MPAELHEPLVDGVVLGRFAAGEPYTVEGEKGLALGVQDTDVSGKGCAAVLGHPCMGVGGLGGVAEDPQGADLVRQDRCGGALEADSGYE